MLRDVSPCTAPRPTSPRERRRRPLASWPPFFATFLGGGLALLDGCAQTAVTPLREDLEAGTLADVDASRGTTDGSASDFDGATPTEGGSDDASVDGALGPDAGPGPASDAAPGDGGGGDAGPIQTSSKAPTQVDFVGGGDKAMAPNGTPDGTILATMTGPITGLILVTTDAGGTPAGGQQWDTITGSEVLPNVGSGFTSAGSATWVLGVFEGTTLLNDGNGNFALAAGVTKSLTLVASSSGFFNTGQHFRLYARDGSGVWNAGPVFAW